MQQTSVLEAGSPSDSAIRRGLPVSATMAEIVPVTVAQQAVQPVAPALAAHPVAQVAEPVVQAPQPAKKKDMEWGRMAFHVVVISLVGVLCLLIEPAWLRGFLLMGALTIGAVVEYVRTRPSCAWKPSIMRDVEYRTRSASTDFGIALSLCYGLFPPETLAVVTFITALADPAARFVGISVGKRKWLWGGKTIEGSAACWAVSTIVAFLMTPCSLHVSLLVGLAAMIGEMIPQRVYRGIVTPSDNFFVPLATGFCLYLANHPIAVA